MKEPRGFVRELPDTLENLIREGRLDEIHGINSGEFVHTVCKLLHELLKEKQ